MKLDSSGYHKITEEPGYHKAELDKENSSILIWIIMQSWIDTGPKICMVMTIGRGANEKIS